MIRNRMSNLFSINLWFIENCDEGVDVTFDWVLIQALM
jgi:hypothetical protein